MADLRRTAVQYSREMISYDGLPAPFRRGEVRCIFLRIRIVIHVAPPPKWQQLINRMNAGQDLPDIPWTESQVDAIVDSIDANIEARARRLPLH